MYLEAFLAPFTGIAGAFVGAFAVRLGATNTQIGLMNSIPSFLVILVSIPFGRILQNSPHKLLWSLGGISLYRIGYMLFALAPLFSGSFITPGTYFVSMFALVAIPIQFFNIGNVGMIIDIIPEEHRATVITIRNVIGSLVNIAGVFLAGQWLNRAAFPGNYQVLFLVAGFIAFLNLFTWTSIRYQPSDVVTAPADPPLATSASLLSQARALFKVFRDRPSFFRFVINSVLLNAGLWTVGPLYVLYTVRQLHASDAWIGTTSTIASLCSLAGWALGHRLVARWGTLVTQRRLAFVMGAYPLLVGLSPSLSIIMVIGGIYNLFTPGFSLGNFNLWLKIVPPDRREDTTAIYNTIMSIGPTIFPLVGVALANHFGISPVLIGCGALALLGSLSFSIWKIQIEDES